MEGLRNFLADMGEKPEGLSLNRIDNDGNYTPENCEWADYTVQAQNRNNNNNLTLGGKTLCLEKWAREIGIAPSTIRKRLKLGWSVRRVLKEAPCNGRNQYMWKLPAAPATDEGEAK